MLQTLQLAHRGNLPFSLRSFGEVECRLSLRSDAAPAPEALGIAPALPAAPAAAAVPDAPVIADSDEDEDDVPHAADPANSGLTLRQFLTVNESRIDSQLSSVKACLHRARQVCHE